MAKNSKQHAPSMGSHEIEVTINSPKRFIYMEAKKVKLSFTALKLTNLTPLNFSNTNLFIFFSITGAFKSFIMNK